MAIDRFRYKVKLGHDYQYDTVHGRCQQTANNDIKAEDYDEENKISGVKIDSEEVLEDNNEGRVEDFRETIMTQNAAVKEGVTLSYCIGDDICIQYLDCQAVERMLCEQSNHCSVAQAATCHSDLIPAVYEGGLKVWECSFDLLQFLHNSGVIFDNKTVLELGCGAGLPGILAIIKGATEVHFQDYNIEVIKNFTVRNVCLNLSQNTACTCRYFSGDWNKFRNHMNKEAIRYDVILTSETIYTIKNYRKLAMIFEDFLSLDGKIYVAAKSHYFGVGGSTRDFKNFITKQGKFKIQSCHTIDAGVPREILALTRQP